MTYRPHPGAGAAAALLLLALVPPAGAVPAPAYGVREWLMGTQAEILIHDPGDADPAGAAAAALAELRAVDRLMAVQRPDSDVSRVNRAGGAATVVDARVIAVLEESARMAAATGGAFDVTVLPAVRAWGFTDGRAHVPAAAEAPVVAGWNAVRVDAGRRTVRLAAPGAQIDLGGIAKGWALDRARDLLRARGVRSAYLDLGGEIATLGPAPDGGRWRIGIRHPRRGEALLGVVELGEGAVSTSGDAEQWVEVAGRRFGHVFDPRTGQPAAASGSVTVVAASATLADALSTAAVVLGPEAARPVLAALDAEAVFATAAPDGRVAVTSTAGAAFVAAPRQTGIQGGDRP